LLSGVACGGSSFERIQPHVAGSADAQRVLADIQRDWLDLRRPEASARMAENCQAFARAHRDDPAAPLVNMYLAVYFSLRSDGAKARALVHGWMPTGEGFAKDLRTIADARLARTLDKHPDVALDALRPLVGRVVDSMARSILLEEIALAAIEAKVDFEAIAYMDGWIGDSTGEEQELARARVTELLKRLPFTVLEATYKVMRVKGRQSGYSTELRRAVLERLSDIALERGDSALARWLMEEGPGARASSDELVDLASSTRGVRIVKGRTIGLVLPGSNRSKQDEAAETVRGLAWALGLPRSTSLSDRSVHLVTRDTGGSGDHFDAALEELAGEGASIIIAGFDVPTASRALAWADATGLTIVTMVAPPRSLSVRRGIVMGEDPEDELEVLAKVLHEQRAQSFSVVETAPPFAELQFRKFEPSLRFQPTLPCDLPEPPAGQLRFPVREARRAGGWVVAGSPECLRDVAMDLSRVVAAGDARFIASTLEAGVPYDDPRIESLRFITLAAGIVPVVTPKVADITDADVRAYIERYGSRPSYWAALGRDVGVLARNALRPLPADEARDDAGIAQRRAIVDAGMLATQERLWSSDAKQVGKDRRLPRALKVVSFRGGIR
jgi:hypothetical protein